MKYDRVMYGLGRSAEAYRVKGYAFVNKTDTIKARNSIIDFMLQENGDIEFIYEVPNSIEMKEIFWETAKNNTLCNNVEFKVLCEQIGRKVYDKRIDR